MDKMVNGRPVLIFAFQGVMGGIPSFYRNIINHHTFAEKVYIKIVLLHNTEDSRPRFTDSLRSDEVVHFQYSDFENQYYVAKRLSEHLCYENARIITDTMPVLNAAKFFTSSKAMIYIVHDYFYIGWALQYHYIINAVVAHSSFFRDILIAASVKEFRHKAFYLPYGVELPATSWQKRPAGKTLNLVFLGRLTEDKGIILLKKIDEIIQKAAVSVNWTIVGKGPMAVTLKDQWQQISYVSFVEARDTRHVLEILENQDILVFPSHFEGTPVAIMEAMSRGVIPVVSDLPGGTRDMVTENEGIRCEIVNAAAYADAIIHLYNDSSRMRILSMNCLNKIAEHYNINKAADDYIRFILSVEPSAGGQPALKKLKNVSRLDNSIYPTWVVYAVRRLLKKLKGN